MRTGYTFFITCALLTLTFTQLAAAEPSQAESPNPSTSWSDPDIDAFLREEGAGKGKKKNSEVSTSYGIFGDLSYIDASGSDNDEFKVGQLVLHGLADFGQGYGGFFEVTLNSDPEWETRVERLQIFWEKDDYLKLSLGRFHVPVTWWNSTYHHGLWLQTTTKRPMMLGFDNAFIPNHAIGLTAEGFIPGLQDYGLRYLAGLSGGDDDSHHSHEPTTTIESMPDAPHDHATHSGPDNHKITPLAGILLRPPSLPRLQLGTVAYTEKYEWDNSHDVDYLALGAHAVYLSERPELIVEYVRTTHEIHGHNDTFNSWSAYAQIAWRLSDTGTAAKFKPYIRAERIEVENDDPMLLDKESADRALGGVRVDLRPNLALKLEYIRTKPDESEASREVVLQAVMKW